MRCTLIARPMTPVLAMKTFCGRKSKRAVNVVPPLRYFMHAPFREVPASRCCLARSSCRFARFRSTFF